MLAFTLVMLEIPGSSLGLGRLEGREIFWKNTVERALVRVTARLNVKWVRRRPLPGPSTTWVGEPAPYSTYTATPHG